MSRRAPTTTLDRRLHRLLLAAAGLGDDEIEVLTLIATRLAEGTRIYGRLHLDRDSRDFQHEALEEVTDALVYVAAALVQRALRRSSRG